MKSYLLLRNNRQTGPHTIEQLGSMGLCPLDLIWIENESTAWKYPEEIEELKAMIGPGPARHTGQQQAAAKPGSVFISLPGNFYQKSRRSPDEYDTPLPLHEAGDVLETRYVKPLEELKENYRVTGEKKPVWNRRIFPSSNAAAIAAVFIGVMLGAAIIKKWVDGYVPDTQEEVAATPVLDRQPTPEAGENFQNALVTEVVPVYKKTPAPKLARHEDIKNQLKLRTNEYKVGLFGGINGLQLTVFNTSSHFVDKALVGVDYLKPNGGVVQSENVLFSSIKPRSAQTIGIPGSNRGVKVRYKIIKVSTHDNKTDMKQI